MLTRPSQNIKDLHFYYSENRNDPTIDKDDSFYEGIINEIKTEEEKQKILNNSLLKFEVEYTQTNTFTLENREVNNLSKEEVLLNESDIKLPEEKKIIQPNEESIILTAQEQKVIAAIVANDYVELNKIAQSNFTPSEALKKEIEGLNLSENKKVGVMAILGYDTPGKDKTTLEKDKGKKSPMKSNIKDQSLKAIDGLFR